MAAKDATPTEHDEEHVAALHEQGFTVSEIAQIVGRSEREVELMLARHRMRRAARGEN